MPFELFIALRYLLAKRKQALISLISLISMIGVGVGVMALIVALGLMTGLQAEMRDRILGSMAHVYVWHQGGVEDYRADVARVQAIDGVLGAAPAADGKALLSVGRGVTFITLKGIDPELETAVTDLGTAMEEGNLADLAPRGDDGLPGMVIGAELASSLQVVVGDTVNLMTDQGVLTPAGVLPRSRSVRVAGIFRLGLYEFDASYGFVSLDFAQRMLGDAPIRIQAKVDDLDRAPAIARTIRDRLGADYLTEDWTATNAQFFSALWLEKMGMSIAVGLIVIVAALNIVGSLVLLVMEKSRDIAILKTMGASSRVVMRIFMMQGLIIGFVGTLFGAIGGVALCWVMDRYELLQIPQDIYQVSHVPFVVLPWDFVVVVSAAMAISFVATLYPSRQASRLDPVQALRFE